MHRVTLLRGVALGVLAPGLVIQLIPNDRDHANPEILREPEWDRAQTRDVFFRSCSNCHSNETT